MDRADGESNPTLSPWSSFLSGRFAANAQYHRPFFFFTLV